MNVNEYLSKHLIDTNNNTPEIDLGSLLKDLDGERRESIGGKLASRLSSFFEFICWLIIGMITTHLIMWLLVIVTR